MKKVKVFTTKSKVDLFAILNDHNIIDHFETSNMEEVVDALKKDAKSSDKTAMTASRNLLTALVCFPAKTA